MTMKAYSIRKAAAALGVNRTVLYGILIGMGIHAPTGARADRGTKPKLLTSAQVRLIARNLAAYRRVK